MNKPSLSHTHEQNQPGSWSDEMFLTGDFSFKGTKPVSNATNLSGYLLGLVISHAKYDGDHYELNIGMLPEDDRNELARLYIESIDREIEYACYGDDESINSSFLCALLSMLKDDTQETRDNFAQVTRDNILVHYKDTLNELLDKACDEYLSDSMNEQGLYAHQDKDNGDVAWGKF